MRRNATLLAALAVAFGATATTVKTATEAFVTNRIADALRVVPESDPVFGAVSNDYLRVGGGPYLLDGPNPWDPEWDPAWDSHPELIPSRDVVIEDGIGEIGLADLRGWALGQIWLASNNLDHLVRAWRPKTLSVGHPRLGLVAAFEEGGGGQARFSFGGQDALRFIDGWGAASGTNGDVRVTRIDRPAVVEGGVTNWPWVRVAAESTLPGPLAAPPSLLVSADGGASWSDSGLSPSETGPGAWEFLLPAPAPTQLLFRVAGRVAAHPGSRLETAFSISAAGDVTASNGVHRLSAKLDASFIDSLGSAAYADTSDFAAASHKHAAGDISGGTLDASLIPDLPAAAITNAPWLESVEESDPTVPAWAKAADPPGESDPLFAGWLAAHPDGAPSDPALFAAATNAAARLVYASLGLWPGQWRWPTNLVSKTWPGGYSGSYGPSSQVADLRPGEWWPSAARTGYFYRQADYSSFTATSVTSRAASGGYGAATFLLLPAARWRVSWTADGPQSVWAAAYERLANGKWRFAGPAAKLVESAAGGAGSGVVVSDGSAGTMLYMSSGSDSAWTTFTGVRVEQVRPWEE